MDKRNLDIVVNVMLLVSTIVASGFFGIFEFISLNEYIIVKHKLGLLLLLPFAFILFVCTQLYWSVLYVLYIISEKSLADGVEVRGKNALLTLVSMTIAACWCLNLSIAIERKNENDEKE